LLIKWSSDVQRNGFVGSNSGMSTDIPKPANSKVRRTVYAKVL